MKTNVVRGGSPTPRRKKGQQHLQGEESCAPQVTAAGPHLTSILRRRAEVCGPSVPPAPGMARVICGQFLASLRDLLQVTSAYALGESRLVYFCGKCTTSRSSSSGGMLQICCPNLDCSMLFLPIFLLYVVPLSPLSLGVADC